MDTGGWLFAAHMLNNEVLSQSQVGRASHRERRLPRTSLTYRTVKQERGCDCYYSEIACDVKQARVKPSDVIAAAVFECVPCPTVLTTGYYLAGCHSVRSSNHPTFRTKTISW